MFVPHRLLKVGSMAESMGIYVLAMIVQKSLGLGRVLLFMYILTEHVQQYGLWGLGSMIFAITAQVVTLGSSHGLMRYVSFYETRGRLEEFYRRMRRSILLLAVALTAVAFAGSDIITRFVIVSRAQVAMSAYDEQQLMCWVALANGLLLGLHTNMMSFMTGMRAYRLVSAVEIFFAVVFTVLGAVLLHIDPAGTSLLVAHLGALLISLLVGVTLLNLAVKRHTEMLSPRALAETQDQIVVVEPPAEAGELTGTLPLPERFPPEAPADRPEAVFGIFGKILKFGMVAVVGQLLLYGVGFISFYLTHRWYGEAHGGVFYGILVLAQPTAFIASAAFAVLFTYVAGRWERGKRTTAIFVLETAYKTIAVVMMSLTVLLYVTGPLWVKILPHTFHQGLGLLGGLLMFFQVVTHLSLMNIVAKLREQPIVITIAGVMGGAVNVLLAIWWMGSFEYGPSGAAWAAGVGMYLGAGAVAIVYLLRCRLKFHFGTYLIMAAPAILCLSRPLAATVWAAVLIVTLTTRVTFGAEQKRLLTEYARRLAGRLKRTG